MLNDHARNLSVVDQAFIDAVFVHNGRQPPRERPAATTGNGSASCDNLRLLEAVLARLDASCGYQDWLKIGAAVFHETAGSSDGLDMFDAWSSSGATYKGRRDVLAKWKSFRLDHPRPAKMGTLRWMLRDQGHDWLEVCAAAEDGFDDLAADAEGAV